MLHLPTPPDWSLLPSSSSFYLFPVLSLILPVSPILFLLLSPSLPPSIPLSVLTFFKSLKKAIKLMLSCLGSTNSSQRNVLAGTSSAGSPAGVRHAQTLTLGPSCHPPSYAKAKFTSLALKNRGQVFSN